MARPTMIRQIDTPKQETRSEQRSTKKEAKKHPLRTRKRLHPVHKLLRISLVLFALLYAVVYLFHGDPKQTAYAYKAETTTLSLWSGDTRITNLNFAPSAQLSPTYVAAASAQLRQMGKVTRVYEIGSNGEAHTIVVRLEHGSIREYVAFDPEMHITSFSYYVVTP